MTETTLDTPYGTIAVRDSGGPGRPLLLVHGNSASKDVFAGQFEAPELAGFRLIAADLPGHGASSDAPEPETAYTFPGYAGMLETVLGALGAEAAAVFGWSLGGHAALEMVGRGKVALAGLMISGTPPIAPTVESFMASFNIDPEAENLTAKRDFTDEDAMMYAFATSNVGGEVAPHHLAMVKRTDGRAREIMFTSAMAGGFLDEREIVATMSIPLAVANGADDPFLQLDYFDTLRAPTLWKHGMHRIEGAGHAPFLQTPGVFNALLAEFVRGL